MEFQLRALSTAGMHARRRAIERAHSIGVILQLVKALLSEQTKIRPQASTVLGALCLSAALIAACETDPVYLGVAGSGEAPFECEEERCFIEGTLSLEEVRNTFDSEAAASEVKGGRLLPPIWHYPLEASMHPSNLGLLTLHLEHSGDDDTIYELLVRGEESTRRLYFPCFSAGGEGCLYQVPEAFWSATAAEFSGQPVRLELRAGDASGVSQADAREIEFSPSPVFGGLYYWSAELRGVYRFVFGGREAVPFVRPGTEANREDCAGCHAVSRDGSTIAFTQGSSDAGEAVWENAAFEGALKVAQVTSLESASIEPAPSASSDSGMMTLSSDGARVVSAYDFRLELRDTASGEVLDALEMGSTTPLFPEFHPEDGAVVVTLSTSPHSEIASEGGAIASVPISGDQFGEPTVLVPATDGLSHYYPSWSPDGRFVAFVSGPEGETSYDQSESRLRLVHVEDRTQFDLDRASGPLGSTSTWPKFAPFSQCEDGTEDCEENQRVFFLSYSSKRRYGLVANGDGDVVRAQLWMSAIRVANAKDGGDPSSVPFWVPYQGSDTSNHLGYWTEALKCNASSECGFGQICRDGECEIIVR